MLLYLFIMTLQPMNMFEISVARRLLGLLNGLRNLGFVLGGFLLVLSIVDQRLLIALAIFLIANFLLAKGNQIAAIVLVLVALGMGAYFEHDYRCLEVRDAADSGANGNLKQKEARLQLIGFSRILAIFSVGMSVIYLGGAGIVWAYRRQVPQLKSQLRWAQRLELQSAILRAQMTPKAIIYFGSIYTNQIGNVTRKYI